MKVVLTVEAVQGALKRLLPAIPAIRKTTMPSLYHVLIVARDGVITMRASDLDLDIVVGISGSAEESGSLLVPGRQLLKFAQAFPKGSPIIIESNYRGEAEVPPVTVSCDSITASYPGLAAAEFPGTADRVMKNVQVDFDALGWVLGALATDENRPILTAVSLNGRFTVSTDSYRLYVCEGPVDTPNMLLPGRTARLLAKIGGVQKVAMNDHELRYSVPGYTLTSRLMPGEFPNWKTFIADQNTPVVLSFEDGDFHTTFKRLAKIISSMDGIAGLPIVFEAGRPLTVRIGRKDATDEGLTALFTGRAEWATAFNPRYMADFTKDSTATKMYAKSNLSPMTIRWEDDRYKHTRVIMPVRVG